MRAAANTSPEPLTNWALSLIEDIFALGAIVLAALHPVVILVIILIFLLILAWILPKVVRRLRRMFKAARAFLGGQSLAEAARKI
jgi:flagellar biogenesis protein FliO